jgi:hypothetical protein
MSPCASELKKDEKTRPLASQIKPFIRLLFGPFNVHVTISTTHGVLQNNQHAIRRPIIY